MADYFKNVEPTAALPLIRYEDGLYFNFKTGAFESPNAQIKGELEAARALYEKSLVNLVKEIRDMQAKKQAVEPDEVKIAIRMSMSEWAAAAKASRLYQNY